MSKIIIMHNNSLHKYMWWRRMLYLSLSTYCLQCRRWFFFLVHRRCKHKEEGDLKKYNFLVTLLLYIA